MSSQAIYRKWRPARFDDVVGQEHVTRTLQRAIASGRIGHAYLLCGPRGTGKTTTARLLAKAVNCLNDDPALRPDGTCHICRAIGEGRFLDLIEIDAASNTGVDDIRDLRDKINFSPSEGRYKVYIIDEVHMLSTAAFNALLKTLEEPPPHAIFVLATTEEHKVPATIKSRCQQFNFRLLTQPEIVDRLIWLAERENLTIEPGALQLIATEGAGSLRDAESLLDQLVTAPGDEITLVRAQQVLGTAAQRTVAQLVEAWLAADALAGLQVIHAALATGADARQFCRQLVAYLRYVLLLQTAGDGLDLPLPTEQKAQMLDQANRANRRALIEAVKLFNDAANTGGNSWQPQLPLELAFIEALPQDAASPSALYVAESPPAVRAAPPVAVAPPPTTPVVATPVAEQIRPAAERATPAEATRPPDATPNATAAAPRPTLADVRKQWPDLLRQSKERDRNLPALLSMAQPLNVEGNQLILGFAYGIFKDKFDHNPHAANIVGELISTLTNHKLLIRSVDSNTYLPPDGITRDDVEALAQELGGVVEDI